MLEKKCSEEIREQVVGQAGFEIASTHLGAQVFALCAEAKPWAVPGRLSRHTCSFLCRVDLSQVPCLRILTHGARQPQSTYSLVLCTAGTAEMALPVSHNAISSSF